MQTQAPQQQPNQPQQGQPPGEFTRMFQSGGGAGQPPPRQAPKPGGYVTAKEGESTQMFQAPTRAPAPLPPRAPAPPPPQMMQPPPSGQGGEFTQMFQRNHGAPLANSNAPAGEFTRQFMNPMANPGPTPDYQMPPMAQQPLGPAPPQKVNEFEELFGGVKAQPRPAPTPFGVGQPNAGGGGLSATSQFNSAPSGSTPAPAAAPMSSPLAPAAGGGSYTQFMKAPGPAEPFGLGMQQQAPKGPAAPPPPLVAKKGIPPIVWIAGGLIIFLIIAVVIVFAFMKK